ncbi:hypothetical protein ILUMI_01683 [Ignelater luminosus]|uniref:Uncharacterized protein n=1 Tax=Ignelater luminosus TaxID=2038154 RepID=A0A8K0GH73_IGNLU|nr:hypothetical protein ILUMI_01683 [Ignelater luminosus]
MIKNKPLNTRRARRERLRLLKYKIRHTTTRKRHVVRAFNEIDTDYGPTAQEPLPDLEIVNRKQKILLDLENSAINGNNIEKATRGQHQNSLWHDMRRNRPTASNFETICLRRKTTSCHHLVKRLLH